MSTHAIDGTRLLFRRLRNRKKRTRAFMLATKGFTANQTDRAMRRLAPSGALKRTTKGSMARAYTWAREELRDPRAMIPRRDSLARVTLSRLRAILRTGGY